MNKVLAENAAKGAAWLDEKEPGWFKRIDLSKLDLAYPCTCVLGQIYGSYHFALHVAGIIPDNVSRYSCVADVVAAKPGFALPDLVVDDDALLAGQWVELTGLWVDEITARMAKEASEKPRELQVV